MTLKAMAGEKFKMHPHHKNLITVLGPCSNKTNGTWYCLTHKEGFDNQLQKDTHIKGSCKMAWRCFEHGFEQP